jgi:internalin A
MLLVGQGSVGKTSLVKRLVKGEFDLHENKTEGINITPWQVAVKDQKIRLNVWDFGGQEIMHATHQFFLTKRSLYLVVLDARLSEEENRMEYWLKIIQSFGGDSPIIIVGNKIDQQPLDIDKSGLQNKYKNIKAFVETSCQTGHGLNELKDIIAKEVGALEHINDQLLATWFSVKDKLEKMKKDYITFPHYVQLCQKEKVNDETSQRTLLGFLHDLGIVLNFRDDPRLEDTNILNPEWVTNGVYKILNSNALFQNKGVLERAMLNEILDSRQYPKDKHLFIMDMMRKFELCFDFEGFTNQKFLIPDLLSKEEPYTGDWQGALAFQYYYNVLPNSIISRFIVRMNAQIYQNTYWRTGVVLAHERNKALVKADIEDRKIFIRINGPEVSRRNLLAIIRSQFDAIHKTIAKIEAVEKVPLPNHPNIVVDYKHLLELETAGMPTFIPEGLLEYFSVRQLLDGIESGQMRRERQESRLREERSVPAQAPPLLEPITQLMEKETVGKFDQIKKQLGLDSQKYAKRIFLLNFGILIVVATGLALLTYKFGWDTMEPWTYFVGIGAVIGSYAYFALTQQEFSPKAIYEQIVEKKKRELHQKFGLN